MASGNSGVSRVHIRRYSVSGRPSRSDALLNRGGPSIDFSSRPSLLNRQIRSPPSQGGVSVACPDLNVRADQQARPPPGEDRPWQPEAVTVFSSRPVLAPAADSELGVPEDDSIAL